MFNWVYRNGDGVFLHGGPCEVTAGAGQGIATLPRNPTPRTERWDVIAQAIRPATGQEITDYDTARQTAEEQSRFDSEKLIKAVAIWTAGKFNIPLQQAKQEILAILRAL